MLQDRHGLVKSAGLCYRNNTAGLQSTCVRWPIAHKGAYPPMPQLDAGAHSRYNVADPVSTPAASSDRLIRRQLGRFFGPAQLHLTESGNLAARTTIREGLGVRQPSYPDRVDGRRECSQRKRVSRTLFAAHARLSDGPFCAQRERTVHSVWYGLVACALGGVKASAGSADIYELERLLVPSTLWSHLHGYRSSNRCHWARCAYQRLVWRSDRALNARGNSIWRPGWSR